MKNIDKIIDLIRKHSGLDEVNLTTDITSDLGMHGDDFHELIENYADIFEMDMTDYLWYFHAEEEGQNIGGFFFRPPNQRVERMIVTPKMLAEFSEKGKWDIVYPKHSIPKKRIDLIINTVLVIITAVVLVFWGIKKLFL